MYMCPVLGFDVVSFIPGRAGLPLAPPATPG